MFRQACMVILLGGVLSSFILSSDWIGNLVASGVAVCFSGWASGMVGILVCAFAWTLVCTL